MNTNAANHTYTREQDYFILKQRASGLSFMEIAELFNMRWGTSFGRSSMESRYRKLREIKVSLEREERWLERVTYYGSVALPRLKCLEKIG